MYSEDDFQYAIENTRVIHQPEQRIQTFGSTVFHFHLVSELMDEVNAVRVRDGEIHAQKPQIISPETMSKLLLEGFGEEAGRFAEVIGSQVGRFALLKYGFLIRKVDVQESIVHDNIEAVLERVREDVLAHANPMNAIIHGVDDAWEVCLIKFTLDMMHRSAKGNLDDFRGRGML